MHKLLRLFLLLLLPVLIAGNDEYIPVYCDSADLFEGIFGVEPIEKMVCISTTGKLYVFTNFFENAVLVPLYLLEERLAKDDLTIADLVVVAHNHSLRPMFTSADIDYLESLYRKGFRGAFVLYVQASKTTRKVVKGWEVERLREQLR